jgi:hypothetical protein
MVPMSLLPSLLELMAALYRISPVSDFRPVHVLEKITLDPTSASVDQHLKSI